MRHSASGDDRFDTPDPGEPPVLVVVVAAVAQHGVGPAAGGGHACPGPAEWPAGGNELRDLVAIAAGQGGCSGMPMAAVIR